MISINLGESKIGFPFFLIWTILSCGVSFSQVHEIGVGVGALSYTGDLTRNYDILSNRPAVQGFYRRNLDNVISLRLNGMIGLVRFKDDDFDSFSIERRNRRNTPTTPIIEASVRAEYNFIDIQSTMTKAGWSPYFYAGLGVFVIDKKLTPHASIPFGMGIKVRHRKVWHIGMEVGTNKTFFDHLDNVSEIKQQVKNYDYGNPNDNDWFHSISFTLSYTIFKVPCPYPYNPFRSTPGRN
jgi:hypothetical protein